MKPAFSGSFDLANGFSTKRVLVCLISFGLSFDKSCSSFVDRGTPGFDNYVNSLLLLAAIKCTKSN